LSWLFAHTTLYVAIVFGYLYSTPDAATELFYCPLLWDEPSIVPYHPLGYTHHNSASVGEWMPHG
jgi:hypothetical protein